MLFLLLSLLKCVSEEESYCVLEEVHKEICGNHFKGWSLAHKILRLEFYWPVMRQDATEFIKNATNANALPIYHKL